MSRKEKTIRAHNEAAPISSGHDFSRLSIPYADYRFTLDDGKEIAQRFTADSARDICDALANALGSGKSKGIPIYFGHPDVPELAPKYPDKRAYGWVTRAEATATGLDLFPQWNEEPGNHFSHISPFWMVRRSDYRVNALISVALVNNPNIPDLRLPNEEAETTKEESIMDMKKLAVLLGLAEDAGEEAITEAISKLMSAAADAGTRAEAAAAEAEEQKEAFANERNARILGALDQALADGRITPAMRGAWQKRLAEDFEAGSVALANEKGAMKTGEVRKPAVSDGGAHELNVTQQIIALANEKIHANPGLTFDVAYGKVKAERPDLFKK